MTKQADKQRSKEWRDKMEDIGMKQICVWVPLEEIERIRKVAKKARKVAGTSFNVDLKQKKK